MAAAGAGGAANWQANFRKIHQVWKGDLPRDEYILNFHEGPIREADLPADFTGQPDYYENNLNMLLAAGDGQERTMPTNVRNNPEYHIYICLPDDTYESGNPEVLRNNLADLHALNAEGGMIRIICYMNMLDDVQINNFVGLFLHKIKLIDTLDDRFNFRANKQVIPDSLLRPGGIIIYDHRSDEEIAAIPHDHDRGMAIIRQKQYDMPFICDEGPHPLGRRKANDSYTFRFCIKIEGYTGGKRRRTQRRRRNKRRSRRRS